MSESPLSAFRVVVNPEEQYSIWDTRREVPSGWAPTGFEGSEAACLDHIDTIWTDMRPLGLREMEFNA
jgi:MbtH protein